MPDIDKEIYAMSERYLGEFHGSRFFPDWLHTWRMERGFMEGKNTTTYAAEEICKY